MNRKNLRTFIADRKTWLLFYSVSLALLNLVLWLDKGIHIEVLSILYMNLLFIVILLVFFSWRFVVETSYIQQLEKLSEREMWTIDTLPLAKFSQEHQTNDVLSALILHYENELEQLQQHQGMEKDVVTAWVHEMKTPLTAMKLILDESRTEPNMQKIESEWLRLRLLLDQQLSMTRLSTLASDTILQDVVLQSMVRAEVKELAAWCMEKQIAVEIEGKEGIVKTDEKWCRLLIRQVLTNAVQYSPVGATITIAVRELDYHYYQLTIKDKGPGIPPHDLPRIFERGFTGGAGRLHNAATGLGLYIAHEIAERLKIHLHLESDHSLGTTVEMNFPIQNEFDQLWM